MFKHSYKNKNKKHVFVYMLCFVLLLLNIFSAVGGLFVVGNTKSSQVLAADLWSSYTTAATKDADGFCIINSPEKLSWFFNESTATKAKLTCDLNMSAHTWNSPIISRNFELDGTGHVIIGLKYSSTLISEETDTLNNTIPSNLLNQISTGAVTTIKYGIGLIGYSKSGNILFSNLSLMIDCINDYVVSLNTTNNNTRVLPITRITQTIVYGNIGYFVGQKSSGDFVVSNCSVYGDLSLENTSYIYYAGGFAGDVNKIIATNCFNYANIIHKGEKSSKVGGVCSYAETSCVFQLCGNYGSIQANSKYLGGLIGQCKGLDLNDSRCFNSGDIFNNFTSSCTGGLVGYSDTAGNTNVSCVYNTGNITASGNVGAIIGCSVDDLYFSDLYTVAKCELQDQTISVSNLTAKELCPKQYWPKEFTNDSKYWATSNGSYKYDFYFSTDTSESGYVGSNGAWFCSLGITGSSIVQKQSSFVLGNLQNATIGQNVYYYNSEYDNLNSKVTSDFDIKVTIKRKNDYSGTKTMCNKTKHFDVKNWDIDQEDYIVRSDSNGDFYWKFPSNYSFFVKQEWNDVSRSWESWPYEEKFKYTYGYLGREYEMFKCIHEYLGGDAVTSKHGYTWDEFPALVGNFSGILFDGICVKKVSQNTVEIMPLMSVSYGGGTDIYNLRKKGTQYIPVEQCGKYTYTFNAIDGTVVSNASSMTFDSTTRFFRNDNINDGLPVFKEMYWELS